MSESEDLHKEGALPADDSVAENAGEDIEAENAQVLAASRKYSRRNFAIAALGAAAGFGVYRWVEYSTSEGMQPAPERRIFQLNARLSQEVFEERALAPTYPLRRAENLRINGLGGLKEDIFPESCGRRSRATFSEAEGGRTIWR